MLIYELLDHVRELQSEPIKFLGYLILKANDGNAEGKSVYNVRFNKSRFSPNVSIVICELNGWISPSIDNWLESNAKNSVTGASGMPTLSSVNFFELHE